MPPRYLFTTLGAGTGGVKPFLKLGFTHMLRCFVDGYFDDQKLLPDGCVSLPTAMLHAEVELGDGKSHSLASLGALRLGTKVVSVSRAAAEAGAGAEAGAVAGGAVQLELGDGSLHVFDAVVAAAPLRCLSLMGVADMLEPRAARALSTVHCFNGGKLVIR